MTDRQFDPLHLLLVSEEEIPALPAQKRRSSSRAMLLAAAERLMLRTPIDRLSVDQIIEDAGVAKGTFYNHFTDKGALQIAVTQAIRADLRGRILAATREESDDARRLARAFCVALAFRWEQPERSTFLIRHQFAFNAVRGKANEGISGFVSRGIASSRFALATTESGILLMYGLLHAAFAQAAYDSDPFASIARSQQLTAIFLRGLGLSTAEAERIAAQEVDGIIRPIFD